MKRLRCWGLLGQGYEMPKVLAHVSEGYPLIDGDDGVASRFELCALKIGMRLAT